MRMGSCSSEMIWSMYTAPSGTSAVPVRHSGIPRTEYTWSGRSDATQDTTLVLLHHPMHTHWDTAPSRGPHPQYRTLHHLPCMGPTDVQEQAGQLHALSQQVSSPV